MISCQSLEGFTKARLQDRNILIQGNFVICSRYQALHDVLIFFIRMPIYWIAEKIFEHKTLLKHLYLTPDLLPPFPLPPQRAEPYIITCLGPLINRGRFVMFSVITNIYNKKTKGPIVLELFTATGKLKKVFFLTTKDVRHGTHRYDIQVVATHASTC